jgi:MinD-like ATPase involved in chromosome partitioning or flagellar assembly
MEILRYDDSLPKMISVLENHLTAADIYAGVVIRDITGKLAFFSAKELSEAEFVELDKSLRNGLGVYGRSDRILASVNDFGNAVLSDVSAYEDFIRGFKVRIVDRRLVGMDWLRNPVAPASPPARFVFASLKGGVGRSTALSVAALHLAHQGKRILVVDLDMEAPGLSAILLTSETLPRFGIVDALVENGISGLDDAFMQDLIGSSTLAGQLGRIDVLPAFGASSIANPADVLGKLARAYAEDVGSDGSSLSILDQVRDIVDRLSKPSRYDVVLIDARAGLHETSASAILGLGADLFFFGLNEEQTFQGYKALFAHLSRLQLKSAESNWLDQVTMVQARASGSSEDQDLFADRCKGLFQDSGLTRVPNSPDDVSLPAEPFRNVPWDDDLLEDDFNTEGESELRGPLVILDDERFKHYSPALRSDLMLPRIYLSTFGPLLDRIDETLSAAGENGAA